MGEAMVRGADITTRSVPEGGHRGVDTGAEVGGNGASSPRPSTPKSLLVRAADRTPANERSFSHPLNPNSEVHGHSLSIQVGLRRTGVYQVRIAPGKESFVYHSHHCEEEWIYVLSGRGIAEVGEEQFEVGPGDFLGFPTPSVAHHMRNPFNEDLVYLSGGEHRESEVVDFPRQGMRLVRVGERRSLYPLEAGKPFFGEGL